MIAAREAWPARPGGDEERNLDSGFVEAWVKTRGGGNEAKLLARRQFLTPLYEHLARAGVGHISEIADAEAPHAPRGCPFQAWSVAELLRLERVVLAPAASLDQDESGPPLAAAC